MAPLGSRRIAGFVFVSALALAGTSASALTFAVLGFPYVPDGVPTGVGGGLASLAIDASGNAYTGTCDHYGPAMLYRINLANGAGTYVADMNPEHYSIKDMSIQPGADILFGAYQTSLHTIDKITATNTIIGHHHTLPSHPGGLAFAADGTLYYISEGNLYTLDPTNGNVLTTVPVSNGLDYNGLGLQPGTGVLYASAHGGTNFGTIYTIDPVTGDATFIEDLDNIGCAGNCYLHDIAFHPLTGVMYGVMGGAGESENPDDLPGALVRFGDLPTAPAPDATATPVPTTSAIGLGVMATLLGLIGMRSRFKSGASN